MTLFTDAVTREAFERWAVGEDFLTAPAEDPIAAHARGLESRRLPPLSDEEAHRAAQLKVRDILRERIIQHQAAITEEVASAERELGSNAVATLSHEAWLGVLPSSEQRALAETLIEELQLGLSIHRREAG
jgi:hypothetical protein